MVKDKSVILPSTVRPLKKPSILDSFDARPEKISLKPSLPLAGASVPPQPHPRAGASLPRSPAPAPPPLFPAAPPRRRLSSPAAPPPRRRLSSPQPRPGGEPPPLFPALALASSVEERRVEEEEVAARKEESKRDMEKEKQEVALEEYHMQLALEMSAREDPEAMQIEVAKQINLGSCSLQSSAAEVVAFRYWV